MLKEQVAQFLRDVEILKGTVQFFKFKENCNSDTLIFNTDTMYINTSMSLTLKINKLIYENVP